MSIDSVDLTAAGSHVAVVQTLETLRICGCRAEAIAVARGAMNGIAEWLTANLGRDAAMAAFQRKADSIIAASTAPGGFNGDQAEGFKERRHA
jgi:hypothetical protein